jgi:Flp pilus assembly protein TadG
MRTSMSAGKLCRYRARSRRGATAVEFALTASVLLLIVFAALEFARANMVRQAITNAAYEGARRGIVPGASADSVRAAAQVIMNTALIRTATVDVTPSDITPDTEEVTVTISVPSDQNGWATALFFTGRTLVGTSTLSREKYEYSSVP